MLKVVDVYKVLYKFSWALVLLRPLRPVFQITGIEHLETMKLIIQALTLRLRPQLDIFCHTSARQLSDRGMKSSSCDMKTSASILPLPGLL